MTTMNAAPNPTTDEGLARALVLDNASQLLSEQSGEILGNLMNDSAKADSAAR